ncbi:MAG: hypothetical protein ABJ308_14310 [Halieaceae bacterium]
MTQLTRPLLLAALLLLVTPAIGQEASSFPGVEALMTAEEYQAAGIDKLSPVEREALNRWLVRYTAEDSQVLLNTDEEVQQAVVEQEVLTRISGNFRGWSGETRFKLENGQVWQQRRQGNYKYFGESNPEVRISKNFMGFYRLEMVESGKSVQVKRIK